MLYFKPINFLDHINIIISNSKKEGSSHCTGKTTLLELIDIILFKNKSKSKKLFFEKSGKFSNFNFIKLDSVNIFVVPGSFPQPVKTKAIKTRKKKKLK